MTEREALAAIDRQVPPARKLEVLLHQPVLRALGRRSKVRFGRRRRPAFRALAADTMLRDTPFYLFGLAKARKLERRVRDEHWALTDYLTATLDAAAEMIRGDEDPKVRSIARYHELGITQP